jgi:hypothetical protein
VRLVGVLSHFNYLEDAVNHKPKIFQLYLSRPLAMHIGNAYNTVHEDLQYREVCARFVRRCLTERHKNDVTRWLFHTLHCFTKQKDEFVESILRGHYIRYCPACVGSGVRLSP